MVHSSMVLVDSFLDVMNKLKNCGLKIKDNINFPLNVNYLKKEKNILFKKKEKIIIENEEFKFYEKLLFPKKSAF